MGAPPFSLRRYPIVVFCWKHPEQHKRIAQSTAFGRFAAEVTAALVGPAICDVFCMYL